LGYFTLCFLPGEPISVGCLLDCVLCLLVSDGGVGGQDRFSSSSFFCESLGLTDPELLAVLGLLSFGTCWDLVKDCVDFVFFLTTVLLSLELAKESLWLFLGD
jgi:hypothetical protein